MASRAELARRVGCSAWWVGRMVAAASLPEDVRDQVKALPPGTSEKAVTIKGLARMAGGGRGLG